MNELTNTLKLSNSPFLPSFLFKTNNIYLKVGIFQTQKWFYVDWIIYLLSR